MNIHPTSQAESRGYGDGALVASAAWLLAGFIGATTVAAGLIQLIDGDAKPLTALVIVLCGGALASTGWVRARAVLDRAQRARRVAAASSAESAGAK